MKKIILVMALSLSLVLLLVGCSSGGSSNSSPSQSISLSSNSLSFDTIGEAQTITATTTPSGQNVMWTSSNSAVATVSGGAITATGNGSCTVTARIVNTEITTTCNVSVNSSISINKTSAILYASTDSNNATTTLTVTTIPAGQDVTWSTGDDSKVTVQKTGLDTALLTCVGATPSGNIPITATITGTNSKAICTVLAVTPSVEIFMPHFFKINMCVSGASEFQGSSNVIAIPNNDLTYSIAPTRVATINSNTGVITAVSSGTATMTVRRTDNIGTPSSASVEVKVANSLTGTGFPTSLSVPIGNMVTIPPITITPFMPNNTELQYVTDNDQIAMIINIGSWRVVRSGLGTTNIYAEVINTQTQQIVYKSAPCQITD